MNWDRRTFAFGLAVMMVGCASGELRVESNPEGAEVIVIDQSRAPKRMGVTPMVLNSANTPGLFKQAIQVNVQKEGFQTQAVFVPETTMSTQGQIVAILRKDDARFVGSATEVVAQVQRLVFKKNYFEAERMLQEAVSRNPSVGTFHSLLGNVYYLQKNTTRALESYQRAQAIEPNNLEVTKMIQKLRGFKASEEGR